MPTREEMESLAREIVRSYEDRIAAIAQLKQAEAERQRTAAREIAQRKSDVSTMLKGFDDAHAAMSRELKADLARVAPALREAEAERQRTDVREIAQRKSDVSTMLKGFDEAHAAMSRELKADLAKVAPALRQAEAERQRTDVREIAQRKSDVSTMLRGFDEAHAAMSRELKADLAKGEEERIGEARALKQELVRGVAERKSAVSAELKELANIQAGARDEWQKLTATMQAKRGGLVVEVKPPEAVAPPPVEEIAEEEAVARAEVAEVIPEIAALQDRVFDYLANHPDGRRLVELEQEFGVARIQMARVLRSLMDENKIEKREGVYFAV